MHGCLQVDGEPWGQYIPNAQDDQPIVVSGAAHAHAAHSIAVRRVESVGHPRGGGGGGGGGGSEQLDGAQRTAGLLSCPLDCSSPT